jgi:hypothetical protein
MKRNTAAGKPFYAYVPFTLVHFPQPAESEVRRQDRLRRFSGRAG